MLTGFAICSFRVNWPVTDTLVLIKIKSRGASVFFGYTIYTRIEDVANTWFRMSIEAVQTWAKIICAPRFLCWQIKKEIYYITVKTHFRTLFVLPRFPRGDNIKVDVHLEYIRT